MPTRKDKTNVTPIYREQVFIPASGATLIKQQARPKIAGRPVSSGVIETVSPEFDLLTGIRGIANLPKGFLKTNKLPQGENLYYRQLDKSSKGLERAKQVGVIDTKSAPPTAITLSSGKTIRIGKTFNTPFFAKGHLWYDKVDDMDVIVGKDNPLLDWKTITKGGGVTTPTPLNSRRTPFYMGESNQAPTELFELYRRYPGIGYRNVTYGFPTIPITGLNTTAEQMKCGGRRKAQLGLDIREGGIAIPIANNMFYIKGRKHSAGGVAIGPNNKNGVEVEDKEVVELIDSNHPSVGRQFKAGGQQQTMRVFSSVPLLRGVSPAELVLQGYNPDDVFKAQEEFKDRNRINDDGTRYQTGGQKIYTPNESIQRQIQETGRITIGGAPTIGGLRTYGYLKGLSNVRKYGQNVNNLFAKSYNFLNKKLQNLINKNKISVDTAQKYNSAYREFVGETGQNIPKTISLMQDDDIKKAGGIYIKPSKRGTFTAAAKKRGMDVQEFASKVLANKEDYSSSIVKKANFARNASRWKKELGGNMIYTINGNVKNGLMRARPKAQYGKVDRKNKDVKVGPDGLIYKRAADGEWYTDGTKHVTVKLVKESNAINQGSAKVANKGKLKTLPVSRTYLGWNDDEEEKETKKIGSLTYEKNENGQWIPSSNQSITTTRSGGRPESFGMTRVGVNHPSGKYKYNPMTGERLTEDGAVETSEPSVKGTTKVSSSSGSTPRRGETKPTSSKATVKSTPTIQDTINQITRDAIYRSNTPKIDLSKVNMPTFDVSQLGSRETKAAKTKLSTPSTGGQKQGRWIGQYKPTTTADWIGLGSNIAGSIASYLLTKRGIDKMIDPIKPVMAQAAKLKTRYNIDAPLSEISQGTQLLRALIRRNTQSSNTSLAREQRAMTEAQQARNQLYGKKEIAETQLINQDRLNRQTVNAQNVATHNDYLTRLYAGRVSQNEAKISNINNLISGLTGSVNNILGTIESRRATNNTLRAIAAANPNVDARLIGGFDYYVDPVTKRKYNKNQQYIGTINV